MVNGLGMKRGAGGSWILICGLLREEGAFDFGGSRYLVRGLGTVIVPYVLPLSKTVDKREVIEEFLCCTP